MCWCCCCLCCTVLARPQPVRLVGWQQEDGLQGAAQMLAAHHQPHAAAVPCGTWRLLLTLLHKCQCHMWPRFAELVRLQLPSITTAAAAGQLLALFLRDMLVVENGMLEPCHLQQYMCGNGCVSEHSWHKTMSIICCMRLQNKKSTTVFPHVYSARQCQIQEGWPGGDSCKKIPRASTPTSSFPHCHSPSSARAGRTAQPLCTATPCI